MTPQSVTDPFKEVQWFDALDIGLEGQGWSVDQLAQPYDRLPAHARGKVTEAVWDLSHETTGLTVSFATDATVVYARYSLMADADAASHAWTTHAQPRVACSGLDGYADDGRTWRWIGHIAPWKTSPIDGAFCKDMDSPGAGLRRFKVYLPLRNGVKQLSIGVDRQATFKPIPPRAVRPIAYYGTSIVHGMAASRPGMTHAALLGRQLGVPLLNLGFAGSAKCEPELAEILAELDPCMFVIDALPNMHDELVNQRMVPFVKILRQARPETPIVLVEDRIHTNAWINSARLAHHAANRAALMRAFQQCLDQGMEQLHYIQGRPLLGDDDEGTVDGSHPTDLGFYRQAAYLRPYFQAILDRR